MVAVLHPLGQGRQIVLDRAVVLVGRSPDCDCVLDTSSRISRMHCALVQVDNSFYVRDLGSMNGVWVNGTRVERDVPLANGDKIAIGDVPFQFFENLQPAAKQPSLSIQRGPQVDIRHQAPAVVNESTLLKDDIEDLVEVVDDVEVIDHRPATDGPYADVPDVVEVLDCVEVLDQVELVGNASLVDVVEIVDDVEVIEPDHVEVIDDVEVLDDPPRHRDRRSSHQRPRGSRR
jgi:hypothetical protein